MCTDLPLYNDFILLLIRSLESSKISFKSLNALILSSLVLGDSPCALYRAAHRLLDNRPNILIINRLKTRRMTNVNHLFQEISEMNVGNVSTTQFEDKSFIQQARMLYESDIVITVHGAALTNTIFMKPCSIVIEASPWLYDSKYFESLAKNADLLYYGWMEGPLSSAPNTLTRSYIQGMRCRGILKKHNETAMDLMIKEGSEGMKLQHTEKHVVNDSISIPNTLSAIKHIYCEDNECRSCAKDMDIIMSLYRTRNTLKQALMERKQCIINHPLYQ